MDITYSFMIPILEAIYQACHSYGWAIVLLTLLVRILVYPLVASSTRSMQRMSQMQPQLKAIQERYKNDPEMFQRKAMEFYQKNKINPMGGCLPTLVQLPILFALFATFTGPPFGDKPIPVKIKVEGAGQATHQSRAEVSGANSPYVSSDGKLCKVVVFPGESTVAAGAAIDFGIRAVEGTMPADLKPEWRIHGDAHGATIDADGHAVFPQPGEVVVEAVIPGVAKNHSFYLINSLGKVATGLDLFKPNNWDILAMIFLFGITMYLSQKLMVQPPPANADPDQLLIQQQTQKTMPIAVTAMFFFIPLPAGVYLYMVVSNVIQSLQTWFIMRTPAPALIDVLAEGGGPPAAGVQTVEKNGGGSGSETRQPTGGQPKKPSGKKKSKKKK
ncbi:MAG TPA: membrane protein insertase YidC [Candidatus Obscuribacterales bacterium]